MSDYGLKQLDIIKNIGRVKREMHVGVYGCGKTYAIMVATGMLCLRLQRAGLQGLNIVLLGKTQQSVKKNMCNPLSSCFGSDFSFDGSKKDGVTKDARLFSQYIHIVGLNDRSAETKFRGISDIFAIVQDEAVLSTEEQFNKIIGRLRGSYDPHTLEILNKLGLVEHFYIGSTNPDNPHHFVKKLIDNGYFDKVVNWNIKDASWNGSAEYYENLLKLYPPGSLDRQRYLECKWVAAEGVIFKGFIENKNTYLLSEVPKNKSKVAYAVAGLDIGGNKSGSSLVITGYFSDIRDGLIVLQSRKLTHSKGEVSPDKLYDWVIENIKEFLIKNTGVPLLQLNVDSAEQYIENGVREALRKAGFNISVADSDKSKIMDRVKFIQRMFSINRLFLIEDECATLISSLSELCYDDKKSVDTILDNGSTDNDTFDAFSYSFTKKMHNYNIL